MVCYKKGSIYEKTFFLFDFYTNFGFWTILGVYDTYSITDDRVRLEDNIKKFINRPGIVTNYIDIKQSINIDNKKYTLFVFDGTLGCAELTKGFNNKYKIEFVGYGSSSFRYRIHKTNKAKYLIIEGRNYYFKINYVKILLDNKEYRIDIPQQEYFLAYCKVSNETQTIFPDINNFKLYDKNNVDITDESFKILLN